MQKRSEFRHLDAGDRDRIHALYGYGNTRKAIAEVLGVHKSTITRELARYGRKTWRYSATRAQEDAEEKRARSKRPGMKIAEDPDLKQYIIRQLKKLRSPDEIAGRMKRTGVHPRVGTNAIYKWLYSEDGKQYCRYLCTRRSRRRRQSRLNVRVLIPERISRKDRPDSPGLIHAEGDLFVSPRRLHSKHCGLLVAEQESKLLSGSIVPNKTHAVIVPAMQHVVAHLSLDTCTFDNGIENVPHRKFGVDAYFCDKGAPWQKPHVEGSIGLVRRWFLPKGTNLAEIPNAVYQSQLHLLNGKYRRSLNYASAYEVAIERGILRRIPKVSLAEAVAFR